MKKFIQLGLILAFLVFVAALFFHFISKSTKPAETAGLNSKKAKSSEENLSQIATDPFKVAVLPKGEAPVTQSDNLVTVSSMAQPQPTKKMIAAKTRLPTLNAQEIIIDSQKMLELAQSGQTMKLDVPGGSITLMPKFVKKENGFQHINFLVNDNPRAEVTLTTDGAGVTVGIIQDPPRAYQIVSSGSNTSYIVELDQSQIHEFYEKDPDSTRSPSPHQPMGKTASSNASQAGFSSTLTGITNSDETGSVALPAVTSFNQPRNIRVKFYYTPVVQTATGGDAGASAMIANQLAIANNAVTRAGANFTFVMTSAAVRSGLNDVLNGTGLLASALAAITNDNNLDTTYNTLRSENADLVHFYTAYQGTDGCGIAYLGDYNVWNEPQYFSNNTGATAYMCNSKYTLAHELGHNLGLDHDLAFSGNHSTVTKENRYNFGYINTTTRTRTIMAYPDGQICRDFYNGTNPLAPGTMDCPPTQAYSALEAANTNNSRKIREVSTTFFNPPTYSSRGSGNAGMLNLVMPFFASPNEYVIDAIQGYNLFQYLGSTYYNNFYIYPTVNIPSSKFVLVKNGTRVIDRFYNRFYHVEGRLADSNYALAVGDRYQLIIENRFGSSTANILVRSVAAPLVYGAGFLGSETFSNTRTETFSIAYSGTPAPVCNWSVNGASVAANVFSYTNAFNLVAGQTLSSYVVQAVCNRTTVQYGNESRTFSRTINVMQPITITAQPIGGSVTQGPLTLSVQFTGHAPSIQWSYSPDLSSAFTAVAGAVNASLTLTSVAQAGRYRATLSNAISLVTTNTVDVGISSAPRATLVNQVALENSNFVYTPTVLGSPTPTVQWLQNGAVIAQGGTLSIPGILRARTGSYVMRATNTVSTIDVPFTITVEYPPEIIMQPPVNIYSLQVNSPFSISITGGGIPAPTYSWQFTKPNGQVLTLAQFNTGSIAIPLATWSNMGRYRLTLSNPHGTIQSAYFDLNIEADKREVTLAEPAVRSPASDLLSGSLKVNSAGDIEGGN